LGLLEASPFTCSPTGSQATQVYQTSLGYLRPPTFLERVTLCGAIICWVALNYVLIYFALFGELSMDLGL